MTAPGSLTTRSDRAPARELILYATPTGALADTCAAYFAAASHLGPTTAQTYPPHCTLTGFFHRDASALDRIADEARVAVGECAWVSSLAVDLVSLHTTDTWVGIELRSQLFLDVADRFRVTHELGDDDDPIRCKDWMHLSLAYGDGIDLTRYGGLATGLFADAMTPCDWEIGLWERTGAGRWVRHT